jgi:hypothetical protein
VSSNAPRSEKWAEWYAFHPEVLASWGESNGGEPPHEVPCPNNTARPTRPEESLFPHEPLPVADPAAPCWCNAFCAYCDHHAKHHAYGEDEHVPCARCPGGLCPR